MVHKGRIVPGRGRLTFGLIALSFVALLTQVGHGQSSPPPDALGFFKNYFITGDYVVGGVGLRGFGGTSDVTGVDPVPGIATRKLTIPAGAVPEDADVVAAFLYWQVVSKTSLGPDSGAVGATFDGKPLSTAEGPFSKVLSKAGSAACWSSGGGTGGGGNGAHKTYTYRADVLGFLKSDDREFIPAPSGTGTVK